MKRFILKYRNQFGMILTSEYKTKEELKFWQNIKLAQGYKLIKK